ncbi:MAG: pyridoxamine 5'-phosphate oxidase family protein [Oscillospiraceae bacterium]|nr:pyridoxamine 5'-phosphate oxidase family protein [Oscillospiraceae bacterium]
MNKELRRKDRAVTDINQIIKIINQAKILHLGLVDNGFPYIVPLHYGYEYDSNRDMFIFYMHGAKTGHKIELLKNNPNVCVELETNIELEPADDVPCQYGSFYSSVIGQGCASIVEDAEEKKRALNLLMENQTRRTFEFTEKMVADVAVIKVEIKEYTAKAKVKAEH